MPSIDEFEQYVIENKSGSPNVPAAMSSSKQVLSGKFLQIFSQSLPWQTTLPALACVALVVFAIYWRTVDSFLKLWQTGTFSHGFLVVPISLYLSWTRRKQLALVTPAPCYKAIPLAALFVFGWLTGNLTETYLLQQFCLVAMMITLFWSIAGAAATRILLMPLGFLFFAVPFGDGLIPIFQDWAAWSSVRMLDLIHVPALREGRFITVPSGKWEVAEACSGVRFLTASLALAYLFAGMVYRSWLRRSLFFLVGAIVPVIANILRITGTIVLGYLRGTQTAVGFDHFFYGGVFFTVIMFLVLSLGWLWREKEAAAAVEPAYAPEKKPFRGMAIISACVLGLLIASAGPLSAKVLSQRGQGQGISTKSPVVLPPWTAVDGDLFGWKPAFSEANLQRLQAYEKGEISVELYVAYYSPAAQRAMVSSANQIYDRMNWQRLSEDVSFAGSAGPFSKAHQTRIRSGQHTLTIWNWYWVDGSATDDRFLAKLLMLKAQLTGRTAGAIVLIVATEDGSGLEESPEVLRDFMSHLHL